MSWLGRSKVVFTRILCPLDLSDFSRRALEHALVLARWYEAELTALHVFSTWVPPGNASTYPAWMRLVPEVREQIDHELRQQLEPAIACGIDVPLVTREGDAVSGILDEAERMKADLIVISTHGRSGFDRFTLGSVTEKVLRKASCPVLVVPPAGAGRPAENERFDGYHRILCAVDFSDSSQEAMRVAYSVAARGKSSITLAHVVEIADNPDVMIGGASPLAELRRGRVEGAREALQELATQRQPPGSETEVHVGLGSSHRELLRIASEIGADLVVMGVRGRGAVDLTLFGSTTNQVVRRAHCDVLTVRTI
jgi:nucleotide-binding universal stress UspA family protein